MTKLLVPVDGSQESIRAACLAASRPGAEVHLLNVQHPLPQSVTSFVSGKTVHEFHEEESDKALAPAEAALRDIGIAYQRHMDVGAVAETISAYAEEQDCDEIVMGVRGLGTVLNLLLGSVTTKVLTLTNKPVTLVK